MSREVLSFHFSSHLSWHVRSVQPDIRSRGNVLPGSLVRGQLRPVCVALLNTTASTVYGQPSLWPPGRGQGCADSCRDAASGGKPGYRQRWEALRKRLIWELDSWLEVIFFFLSYLLHFPLRLSAITLNPCFDAGHFGTVYHGYLMDHKDEEIHCAVKSLNSMCI